MTVAGDLEGSSLFTVGLELARPQLRSDDVMQHRLASTAELGQGGPGLTLTVTAGQAESGAGVGARFQGHCVSGLTRRTRA